MENNTAGSGKGGGLSVENATALTLSTLVVRGNTAQQGGGAYLYNAGLVAADGVDFQNNTASTNGGGLWAYALSGGLVGVSFTGNSSVDGGGGAYLVSNPGYAPAFTQASFVGNQSRVGGGLAAVNTTPIVRESIFRGNLGVAGANQTPLGGALYLQTDSSLTSKFVNVIFVGNMATLGGAVYGIKYKTRVEFSNVTMAGNYSSSSGGAINFTGGYLGIKNSILWDNHAGGNGDNLHGLYNTTDGPLASVTIENSLLSGGCAGITGNHYRYTGLLTCTNILTADPLFVQSPVGTDGVAGTADDVAGNLQLQLGSPALNAGDNAVFSGIASPLDQAGNPRIVNTTVDLGALERQ